MRYDINGLAEELEVELDSIAMLFTNYFIEMKEEIADMQSFLENKDWYMLERVIHNVKGVSANLNIKDVFSEAAVFDDKLKNNITDGAEGHVRQLVELIKNAEADIIKFFSENGIALNV